jgi:uncharacterized protein GlcG (DUF336 family)
MNCARATALAAAILLASACGGGGGDGAGGSVAGDGGCTGGCAAAAPTNLGAAEVHQVIAQAVQEAQARATPATIAVVDRAGNVLAVFRMTGAGGSFKISGERGVTGGLEAVAVLDSALAAIAKAITGAYLSSEGNAFSSRTASQIVQQNFNPGETGSPGGPLFGVQFSQLPCSDLVRRPGDGSVGPKRSPLGLSADPGGLPLYKNGTVVGGIGVIADGSYSLDLDVSNVDASVDELIAVAAARGFDAPDSRRANRITADGRTLRYVDSEAIASNPATASFAAASGMGAFVNVPGYYVAAGGALAGTAFAFPASGVRADAATPEFAGLGAYVLVDAGNTNRFPSSAGTDGLMTQAEVARILAEALRVANRARAQIRRPLGAAAQVNISVVDTNGALLGFVRTPDAPMFGADVSLQKARTAMFLSHPNAAGELSAQADAIYLNGSTSSIAAYVLATRAFLGDPAALSGTKAFSARAAGNLSRPFYPDGINASGNHGPLSKAFPNWSPFSDGLQLDLAYNGFVGQVVAPGAVAPAGGCTGLARAPNGIQIFPGGVPIYRGAQLVGGIGVSGDGVDQDDLVAFLGLANAGVALASGIANAPSGMRADTIFPPGTGTNLRYVQCPQAPFIDSTQSNACNGI